MGMMRDFFSGSSETTSGWTPRSVRSHAEQAPQGPATYEQHVREFAQRVLGKRRKDIVSERKQPAALLGRFFRRTGGVKPDQAKPKHQKHSQNDIARMDTFSAVL